MSMLRFESRSTALVAIGRVIAVVAVVESGPAEPPLTASAVAGTDQQVGASAAAQLPSSASQTLREEENEITFLHFSHTAAAAAKAVDDLLSLHTEDAVLLPPGEPAVRGRAGIRAWLATGTFPSQDRYNVDIDIAGNRALCAIEPSGASAPSASGQTTGRARVVWWLVKGADGKWRIARSIWNAVPTPAAKQVEVCSVGAGLEPGDPRRSRRAASRRVKSADLVSSRPRQRGDYRGRGDSDTFRPTAPRTCVTHSASVIAPDATHCSSVSDARHRRNPAASGPTGWRSVQVPLSTMSRIVSPTTKGDTGFSSDARNNSRIRRLCG